MYANLPLSFKKEKAKWIQVLFKDKTPNYSFLYCYSNDEVINAWKNSTRATEFIAPSMTLGWVSILRHNRTVTVRDSFGQQLSPVCFTMKHLTTKNVRLYFFTAFFICLAFRCLLGMAKTTRSFSRGQRAFKDNTTGFPDVLKRLKSLEEK